MAVMAITTVVIAAAAITSAAIGAAIMAAVIAEVAGAADSNESMSSFSRQAGYTAPLVLRANDDGQTHALGVP